MLKDKPIVVEVPTGDPLTQQALDRTIISMLEERNDFRWEWVDVRTLWSATLYNDHSVSIGYKPTNAGYVDEQLHTVDVKRSEWRAVHDAIIELVLDGLNRNARGKVTLRDILVEDDPVLPIITLRITDKDVITRLLNLENVRYIEPLDY